MTVASLNARLLARKGDARPAPIDTGEGRARPIPSRPAADAWPAPAVWPEEPVAGDPRSRARVSLRLDDARHRRLRLAAIHLDASLQQILTHALDQYLAQVALDCPCMARGRAGSEACQAAAPSGGGAA
ncbi:hypothetical protein CKO28_23040 [Rhodovibrio sodomensis]|uniref:Ribbon-helix-helix protein CopG domain-containing protein n=1 Tax=Rhodovibrio sodomensis TaxID=1088 RepID=A0ABS1DK62_9PROT|nr:hypothetical protein [Rhodovibrio sodomensis]MBK1670891.1 hypothetical protein [Rhodovibrio sodomensis]